MDQKNSEERIAFRVKVFGPTHDELEALKKEYDERIKKEMELEKSSQKS